MKTGSYLRKKSILPLARLERALWKVFSLFIKIRDNWTCFTCGERSRGPRMHAGHFIEDAVGGLALRYNETNVHAQCENCNCHSNDMKAKYEKRMIDVYGLDIVLALKKLKHKVVKDFDFKTTTDYYKQKVENMIIYGPLSFDESI